MVERFSGCRVLSYCLMTNHFHLLLEVPPSPTTEDQKWGEFGVSEKELLYRLGGLYSRAYVAGVVEVLREARMYADGKQQDFERLSPEDQAKSLAYGQTLLKEIFGRYTRRMHDLAEFMRALLQRFTRWFNKQHGLRGTLWEDRFHSIIVEGGLASRTMAAYIDLNPVRAGICEDAADYRWSSYGESVGGGRGQNIARSGLVRALHGHKGHEGTARAWAQGGISKEYRRLIITEGVEAQTTDGTSTKTRRKGMKRSKAQAELDRLVEEKARDLKVAKVARCQVRYFTKGAVLGSRKFVDDFFIAQRERFSKKRQNGARRPRGTLKDLAGEIWSLRDLKDG